MAESRVLVMDEDEASCSLIKTVLSSRGFHVSVALTARVGLGLHQESAFNLIFIDLNIKDLDARYIVREIMRRDDSVSSGYLMMSFSARQGFRIPGLQKSCSQPKGKGENGFIGFPEQDWGWLLPGSLQGFLAENLP